MHQFLDTMTIDQLIDYFRGVADDRLLAFVDDAVIDMTSQRAYRVATMELALRYRLRQPDKKSA
jgi:hypothetical protein